MKRIVIGGMAILVMIAFTGNVFLSNLNAAEQERKKPLVLRYSDINPPNTPPGKFAGEFARLVEEKTNGKIKIDVYYSASLVGYDIEPVQTGVVDFNQMIPSFVADLCPRLSVLDAPYVWKNEMQTIKMTDPRSPLMEDLNKCLEKNNVRLLILLPVGMRHLTTTNTPVYSPADLKGLKIRVVPSPVYSATIEAMGAIPTPMPFPELPTALATGVVDGQENPFCIIVPHGLHEIQKYIMLTGHLPTNGGIFMNLPIWNNLRKNEQEKLTDAAIEARDITVNWVHEMNETWKAKAIEKGTKIIGKNEGLKLDEFIEVTREPVHKKFEKDWGDLYNKILGAS
jgi:tripartite ATP-independent transporter DctP family solute receptor